MEQHEDRKRLLQEDRIGKILQNHKNTDMITVYKSDYEPRKSSCTIYSALIPDDMIKDSLSRAEWDLMIGQGFPGIISYYEEKGGEHKYFRFGNEKGIEPLVVIRDFHGVVDSYPEISQEFIFFHNLHYLNKEKKYIKYDEYGNDILVAVVNTRNVQIRAKEIREFLTAKNMHLSIQFDCDERSLFSLEELGIK